MAGRSQNDHGKSGSDENEQNIMIYKKSRRYWSRFILPGITIIFAGISLIWPFLKDAEVSFTLSKDQSTASDGRVLMTNLRYTGVDRNDRLFLMTAREGEQQDPAANRILLTGIDATIDIGDNKQATLGARSGLYRIPDDELSLTGDVRLASGKDFSINMAGAEIDLAAKTVYGQGSVTGTLEIGRFSADEVQFFLTEKRGVLAGRVSFQITPKKQKNKESAQSE